jgi:hypothetical protein
MAIFRNSLREMSAVIASVIVTSIPYGWQSRQAVSVP